MCADAEMNLFVAEKRKSNSEVERCGFQYIMMVVVDG
jgi:hypothetical protein